MNAKEARELSIAAQTGNRSEIDKAIERAVKVGDFDTHVYFNIPYHLKKELEGEGYKITDVSERNETCVNISWRE